MEYGGYTKTKIHAINLCGGVACNRALRDELSLIAQMYSVPLTTNQLSLCTDNAAMIAWMAWELKNSGSDCNLRHFDRPFVPQTVMPLGDYSDFHSSLQTK